MIHWNAFLLFLVCAVIPAQADLLPPARILIATSGSGRYLLRYDEKFELFERSADKKTYCLVSQFHAEDRFAIKVLVSEEASLVVVFGNTYENPKAGGRDEIVCTYSLKGELLRTWRLDEILSEEDMKLVVSHSVGGSLWMYHEVALLDSQKLAAFAGPTDSDWIIERRFLYFLDLKSGTWEQRRGQIIEKMPNKSPEPMPQKRPGST